MRRQLVHEAFRSFSSDGLKLEASGESDSVDTREPVCGGCDACWYESDG